MDPHPSRRKCGRSLPRVGENCMGGGSSRLQQRFYNRQASVRLCWPIMDHSERMVLALGRTRASPRCAQGSIHAVSRKIGCGGIFQDGTLLMGLWRTSGRRWMEECVCVWTSLRHIRTQLFFSQPFSLFKGILAGHRRFVNRFNSTLEG